MNKTLFEGKWKEIRGKSKDWWSLINDIDLGRLDKSPDKLTKYVMLLQVKYGYTSKFAGEEINRHLQEAQKVEENKLARRHPAKPGWVRLNARPALARLADAEISVNQSLNKESTK